MLPSKALKTAGLILKKIPYGEKDSIVTLLTEGGKKLVAFASGERGSQKRFGGALDFFNYVGFFYTESRNSEMVRLQEAQSVVGFTEIRSDLLKFAAVTYFAEMILTFLPENQSQIKIYQTFFSFIQDINRPEPLKPHLIPLMQHYFLGLFGFKPDLENCQICRNSVQPDYLYFFHGERGGLVCSPCHTQKEAEKKIKERVVRQMEYHSLSYEMIQQILQGHALFPDQWKALSWETQEILQIRKVLEFFIDYTAGKSLKSVAFLSQMMS